MRFTMLMIPNVDPAVWAEGPDVESVAAMGAYNQELVDAGVLLAGDGFFPPTEGARITREGGEVRVGEAPQVDGHTVGGYWIIDVASKDDAVAWARRCPLGEGDVIELRRVYEVTDHPEDVQEAGRLTETPPEQTAAR